MTIYLVRHGSAGSRDETDPHDLERRIDEVGRRQAEMLVEFLADSRVDEVRSSPAPRCVETVGPLATAHGLDVEPDAALLEGSRIEDSWTLVTKLAAAGRNAVLCSHGDVIPEVVRRAQLRGMEVPGPSGCSKGSLWTLEWADGSFRSGRYQPVKP